MLTKERQPLLPDVPTLHETVMPEFESLAWAGLFGPAGMPADAVNVLADAMKKTLAKADAKERFLNAGCAGAVPGARRKLADFVKAELVKYNAIKKAKLKEAGIQSGMTAVAKLKVLCARSMSDAVNTLNDRFAHASGHTAEITFGTVGALAEKLAAGETADVLILGAPAIAKMAGEGALVAGSDRPIAKTSIGACVREGAAAPDISSPDAFRRTLTDARVIALSDPAVAAAPLAPIWSGCGSGWASSTRSIARRRCRKVAPRSRGGWWKAARTLDSR